MKKLISIALCLLLCLGFCAAAFADGETGMSTDLSKVYIAKQLNVADNIFANVTHDFTVVFGAGKFVTDIAGADKSAPAIPAQTITVAAPENGVAAGSINLTFLNTVEWTHAGKFTYPVSEQNVGFERKDGDVTKTLVCDNATFTLEVYVINGENNKPQVAGVIVKNAEGEKVDPSSEEYTEDGFGFENTYTEVLEIPEDEGGVLSVNKSITGDTADKTQKFAISVAVTLPATATAADVAVAEGVTLSGLTATANLADGESLVFTKLPAGATVVVSEQQLDGYKGSAAGFVTVPEKEAGESWTSESSDQITEQVEINITNNLPYTPPTGVVINNLPFVLLVVLAVGGLTVYFFSNRRRDEEA